MEPRKLDTPEHAAYRAAILAHGQENDPEVLRTEGALLREELGELHGLLEEPCDNCAALQDELDDWRKWAEERPA